METVNEPDKITQQLKAAIDDLMAQTRRGVELHEAAAQNGSKRARRREKWLRHLLMLHQQQSG